MFHSDSLLTSAKQHFGATIHQVLKTLKLSQTSKDTHAHTIEKLKHGPMYVMESGDRRKPRPFEGRGYYAN